jgi:hypothetical protein
MSSSFTDVIRRVFTEDGSNFIEIGPWPEVPDMIELRTVKGEFSADYFGNISIAMKKDFAEQLGMALLNSASEMKKDE